jgi:6-pyruvoyltetrahydropterin/6-carboxytetrahydropterin synthase
MEVYNQLKPHIEACGAQLDKIKLCETENNFVEYYGS